MLSAMNIALTHNPLDVAAAVAEVTSPDAGGIALFLGTTRAELASAAEPATQVPSPNQLLGLEYYAYDEMALAEMHKIVEEAKRRWPIRGMVVRHRLGMVKVGEASVVIAVSCPHRGEAFAACQFVIDELKKTVPIWKKELFANGQHWQGE
jgi:molybdopterin synthase catalytic subunit